MSPRISSGQCNLCGESFKKNTITRHLKSCQPEKLTASGRSGGRTTKPGRCLHLLVEGRYQPEYWMHLQVPMGMKLSTLDGFLRTTWLECCGHLSAFRIDGNSYTVARMIEFDDKDMNVAIGKVLSSATKFSHEYDFGSTTELALSVVEQEEMAAPSRRVVVLARNTPPEYPCMNCQSLAIQICVECSWEGDGLLCGKCVASHECDEEMLLPVVNSPRVGVCGYEG